MLDCAEVDDSKDISSYLVRTLKIPRSGEMSEVHPTPDEILSEGQ
jgi:hypothetical protein